MFTISDMPNTNCTAFHDNKKRKLFAKAIFFFSEEASAAGKVLTKTEQLWNN